MTSTQPSESPLLHAALNLSRFHREHEKFYATAPRETAVTLQRHARTLEAVDFTPTALRADLEGPRRSPRLLYSVAEMINRAADLSSDSAGLVNDNERRWRVFRARVTEVVGAVE